MDEVERLPCLSCRAPVDLTEPDCPHCGASLLVDVLLQRPPTDARVRYQLIKAVQLLAGAPPQWEIQRALSASPPALACGVTRAFAHAVLPILAQNGVRGSIERHAAPAQRRFTVRAVAGFVAAVVLLGVVLVGWQFVVQRLAPTPLRLTEKDLLPSGAPGRTVAPARGTAPSPVAAPLPRTPRELAQSGLRAGASLRCANSVGSGFFVDRELLVTNAHVLCGTSELIQVSMSDERKLLGKVLRRAPKQDLALVHVAGANARPLELGDVGELAVGDKVVIVGSPVGLDFTVHEGSVSSLQRSTSGVAYVQLDAKISPGNSGGPVIDGQGRVVAVVSMKIAGDGVEGIGLAVPVNYIYGAALDFVKPPSPSAASSPAFAKMAASAELGLGGMAATEAGRPGGGLELDQRPLLVAAYVDQYKRLVVRIVRASSSEPRYEEVSVKLWNGIESFCTIKGDVTTWKRGDAQLATSGMDPRAAAALAQLTRGQSIFVGESALHWDLCDNSKLAPGIEIELEGAHPAANRLKTR